MERISKAELARRLGFSRAYITQQVKKGRIKVDASGKVNEAEARRSLEQTADPARKKTSSAPAPANQPEAADIPQTEVDQPSYANIRTMHEGYKAKLAKLEFERKSGSLIEIDEVKRQGFKAGRVIRDSLLAIPDRVSSIIVASTDEQEVRNLLRQEITQALGNLIRGR